MADFGSQKQEYFMNQAMLQVPRDTQGRYDRRGTADDLGFSGPAPDARSSSAWSRPASFYGAGQGSRDHKPIKSQSCDKELLLVSAIAGSDVTTRRLSQGDLPLWLHEVS